VKWLVNICRIVVALTFIFSGYVKAIDPLGTQYKIEDYLEALSLAQYVPSIFTLGTSVLLSAIEFCLGIFLLFAIHRRSASKISLVFMVVMTLVTLWLWIANPVSDCGCFGDAIHLTNGQTLLKNIVLLACTAVIAWRPLMMMRFISQSNQWIVVNYTVLFILASSIWSLWTLPLFDFRPYHVGANIQKGMEIPEGAEQPEFETTFIMEKDGKRQEFTLEEYPDSTWTFIDQKNVLIKEGYVPPIHDFSIQTIEGEDLTEEILSRKGYTFLLISPHLENADDSNFGEIDQIYEYALEHNYPFICLTASNETGIQHWRNITGAEYPFYLTDETTLKTVIRSNPGLLLLKDGTIIRKWSHNQLPDFYKATIRQATPNKGNGVQESIPLEKSTLGQMPRDSVPSKLLAIFLWFALPLFVLTLADRLFAWTKWIRRKQQNSSLYKHLKPKRKMRKKIVAGNWKMNMNLQDGIALAKELNETLKADKPNCGVVICTPFIHLASIAQFLDQDIIGLGAENCADKEKGAFTGEVSAEMVKSTGAQYVILGHSERREYYNETPEILKEKVLLAQKNDLKVIFCIGESLAEREAGKQNEVVKAELEGSVFNLSEEDFRKIVIAYEPIWAIGTGKTATAEQAEEIHAYIRSIIAEKYGQAVADDTTILYGGSCKASNAPELFAKPDIDGGLIGGASLKCADFKGIIDAWKK